MIIRRHTQLKNISQLCCSNRATVPRNSAQYRRQFASVGSPQPSIAAPEINFSREGGRTAEGSADVDGIPLYPARVVPVSRSYFTGAPTFFDKFLRVQEYGKKYARLPENNDTERRVLWTPVSEYRATVGEMFRPAKYREMIDVLKELDKIHPIFMPPRVKSVLEEHRQEYDTKRRIKRTAQVDEMGRAAGAGRRKRSTAKAYLVEGTGEILINGKSLAEAFGRVHDRESAIWALKATNRIDRYNVFALVEGGGTTGQAEALTIAIAKGLIGHEPALKTPLRIAGCITRDIRSVERKKAGRDKARKAKAWVKR